MDNKNEMLKVFWKNFPCPDGWKIKTWEGYVSATFSGPYGKEITINQDWIDFIYDLDTFHWPT